MKGVASIQLALSDITQGDKNVRITTDTYGATANTTKTRDGEIIAVIGAIAGGGAGAGTVLATKGKGIHFGPETLLNFTLADSVRM